MFFINIKIFNKYEQKNTPEIKGDFFIIIIHDESFFVLFLRHTFFHQPAL